MLNDFCFNISPKPRPGLRPGSAYSRISTKCFWLRADISLFPDLLAKIPLFPDLSEGPHTPGGGYLTRGRTSARETSGNKLLWFAHGIQGKAV